MPGAPKPEAEGLEGKAQSDAKGEQDDIVEVEGKDPISPKPEIAVEVSDRPLWINENQVLVQKEGKGSGLSMATNVEHIWIPSATGILKGSEKVGFSPPAWLEMIIPKAGMSYDNTIPVYSGDGEVLIGRPVEEIIVEEKDAKGVCLYNPVIDEDTDEDGWFYGTAWDRLDAARDGGRAVARGSDRVRRRLWRFGEKLPPPSTNFKNRTLVNAVTGLPFEEHVLSNVASAPGLMAKKIRKHVLKTSATIAEQTGAAVAGILRQAADR